MRHTVAEPASAGKAGNRPADADPSANPPPPSPRDGGDRLRAASGDELFRIERHGDVDVFVASPKLERLPWDHIESAGDVLHGFLAERRIQNVVVDLTGLKHAGSVFLSLLLRLERAVRLRKGSMVLCGVGTEAREVLRVTSLDTLLAIYDSRAEALATFTLD